MSDLPELTQIGHYLIKGLLRHGTSADSYFAENASMRSQKVLLRVLLPETASDPAFVRSFMEEARIAARLDHNCIASVLDLKDDGERIYAVLEFIEGLELNELLERFGPPPPEVAAAIMREVCSALEHAHGKSILHRRLRPRLIKVTPEGGVKVLGFGLRERESFLQSAVMPDALREELYRPAEQVREEPQDVRGDLYTLAVIMYELLTQRLPFDTIPGPAGKAAPRKPPSIYEGNPLVPAAFGRLIERMLSERREDRPADAGEARRALDDLLDEYRVMHSSDLLQLYLGNPPDYTEQARRRSVEYMVRDAERLSKGSEAERRAAIEELERVLAAEPGHKQAQSLVRKLKPASDPGRGASTTGKSVPPAPSPFAATPAADFDPNKTIFDAPGSDPAPSRPSPRPPAGPVLRTGTPNPKPALAAVPPPKSEPKAAPAPASSSAGRTRPSDGYSAASTPRGAAPASAEAEPEDRMRKLLVGGGIAVGVLAIVLTLFVWRPWAPKQGGFVESGMLPADSTLRLDVETNPPGALVTLPGTGESRVSPTWFENLKPGQTRVHVALSGYLTRDTVLDLAIGAPGSLRLDLISATAGACTLFVAVNPRAEQVLVDGLPATMVDSASWFMPVEAGTHAVDVTATGFEKWSKTRAAKITEGVNGRVSVTLKPAALEPVAADTPGAGLIGSVTVSTTGSTPWTVSDGTKVTVECEPEAQLVVDGVTYPSLVKRADLSMGPGEHRFRFVHPDYKEAVQFKKLKAGQKSEKVKQDFRTGQGILSISAGATGLQVFLNGKFKGYTPVVVREVKPGRCQVELRDKAGKTVIATKDVIVENSSRPIDVKF